MCTITTFLIAGFNSQEVNRTMLPVIHAHSPAGASTMNMLHYGQIVRSWLFRQYDHGALNIFRYGQMFPPLYRFTTHTAPVSFYHSTNDWMVSESNFDKLFLRISIHFRQHRTTLQSFTIWWAQDVFSSGISYHKLHSIIWTLCGQLTCDRSSTIEWFRTWPNGMPPTVKWLAKHRQWNSKTRTIKKSSNRIKNKNFYEPSWERCQEHPRSSVHRHHSLRNLTLVSPLLLTRDSIKLLLW